MSSAILNRWASIHGRPRHSVRLKCAEQLQYGQLLDMTPGYSGTVINIAAEMETQVTMALAA